MCVSKTEWFSAHLKWRMTDLRFGAPPVVRHTACTKYKMNSIIRLVRVCGHEHVRLMSIKKRAPSWQNQQCGCAPSEDSDQPGHSYQPGHPPSLIRIFAVRMKKAWVLSYSLSAQRRLIRLGGCPGWFQSSLGAQPLCWCCEGGSRWGAGGGWSGIL